MMFEKPVMSNTCFTDGIIFVIENFTFFDCSVCNDFNMIRKPLLLI